MIQFKIDENLHTDAAALLRQHGHDALTVHDQGLRGGADCDLAQICRQEKRAIVTLDLDFSALPFSGVIPGEFSLDAAGEGVQFGDGAMRNAGEAIHIQR